MRTTTGIASKNRKYLGTGRGTPDHKQGIRKVQKEVAEVGKPVNGFLTSVFKPLKETEINPLYCAGNYHYLYDSAKNYARLLGENFTLKPDPENFEAVCDKLEKLLPGNLEIRLFVKKKRIHLKVINNLDTCTLFYVPCKIIDEAEGEFRDILIEFFRLLQWRQNMTPLLDNQHFEMWQEELDNYYDNNGEEPDDKWMQTVKSYTEGEIARTLNLISEKPVCDEASLLLRIGNYTTSTGKEKKILRYMKKGLKFLRTGKVLFHYTNAPRLYNEEYPVDADNIFMVVYDDDVIMENLIEYMNSCAMEIGYEFFSSIDKTITPKTKSLAKPDKFISGFLEWINDFTYVLYNG